MALKRYTAKLLFQFRVTVAGSDGKRRLCEERFIMFQAPSARKALQHAKRRGREGQHAYKNSADNTVRFEFVGVMELLELGSECGEDEVWYEIKQLLTPRERKQLFIPPERTLHAFRMECERGRSKR
jgi:hypothetical protein